MELFEIISSLFMLIILEIALGIDNLVFLSILTERLPPASRRRARRWGLMLAWVTRIILLVAAVWLIQFSSPLFQFQHVSFSIRDLFLLLGGAFLLAKATEEIHYEVVQKAAQQKSASLTSVSLKKVIVQVGLMDLVFSLDSILAAIGLTTHLGVMVLAITCSILIMIYASEPVSRFIDKYPTIKMLALSFLMLIGMVLVADGLSFHIPRGYIYFAMGFSLTVEMLNHVKRSRRRNK